VHTLNKLRLRRGVFLIDVIPDTLHPKSLFHYVVQRDGTREILALGQERTATAAREAGLSCANELQQEAA
jgi:hypothetical protein